MPLVGDGIKPLTDLMEEAIFKTRACQAALIIVDGTCPNSRVRVWIH